MRILNKDVLPTLDQIAALARLYNRDVERARSNRMLCADAGIAPDRYCYARWRSLAECIDSATLHSDGMISIEWAGMYLGIEPDGYTHS